MFATQAFCIITLYALIVSIAGLPWPSNPPPPKGVSEDANFDNRTVSQSVVPLNDLTNTVGVEKGLYYNSFVLISGEVLGKPIGPITPHTLPNAIVTANSQQLLNGTPSITVNYKGSKYETFDFKSFWFGCGLNNVEGVADATVQCTIYVSGFRSGQQIATATFTFSPTLAQKLTAPMIQAELPPNFVGLDNATIIQSSPTLQALNLDNFDYVLYPWE